jgi:hypothetical protein
LSCNAADIAVAFYFTTVVAVFDFYCCFAGLSNNAANVGTIRRSSSRSRTFYIACIAAGCDCNNTTGSPTDTANSSITRYGNAGMRVGDESVSSGPSTDTTNSIPSVYRAGNKADIAERGVIDIP